MPAEAPDRTSRFRWRQSPGGKRRSPPRGAPGSTPFPRAGRGCDSSSVAPRGGEVADAVRGEQEEVNQPGMQRTGDASKLQIAVEEDCDRGREKAKGNCFELDALLEFIELADGAKDEKEQREITGKRKECDREPCGARELAVTQDDEGNNVERGGDGNDDPGERCRGWTVAQWGWCLTRVHAIK